MPPEEQTLTGMWDRYWWRDGHVCWLGLCLVAKIFHRAAYSPRLGNHRGPMPCIFSTFLHPLLLPWASVFLLGRKKDLGIMPMNLVMWKLTSWSPIFIADKWDTGRNTGRGEVFNYPETCSLCQALRMKPLCQCYAQEHRSGTRFLPRLMLVFLIRRHFCYFMQTIQTMHPTIPDYLSPPPNQTWSWEQPRLHSQRVMW